MASAGRRHWRNRTGRDRTERNRTGQLAGGAVCGRGCVRAGQGASRAGCGRGRAGRSRGARGGGQSAAASVLTDPDAGVNRPRGDRPESGGGNAQPGDPEPRSSRRRRGLPDALGLANTHSNGLGNSDSAAPGQKMRSSRNGSTRPRRSGQSQVAAIRRRGSGLVRVEQAAGRRRRPRGDGFRGRSTGSGFGQGSVRVRSGFGQGVDREVGRSVQDGPGRGAGTVATRVTACTAASGKFAILPGPAAAGEESLTQLRCLAQSPQTAAVRPARCLRASSEAGIIGCRHHRKQASPGVLRSPRLPGLVASPGGITPHQQLRSAGLPAADRAAG